MKVISFAGELLKLAEDLLRSGLHTAEIVTGYQRALEKTFEILPGLVVKTVDNIRDPVQLKEAVKSVLATKQYGYEDLLTELVCNACLTTMSPTAQNPKLNMDSVRISKLRGGTIPQSSVVKVRLKTNINPDKDKAIFQFRVQTTASRHFNNTFLTLYFMIGYGDYQRC